MSTDLVCFVRRGSQTPPTAYPRSPDLRPPVGGTVRSETGPNNGDFTPRILAFCCHYCAYAAADLAGSTRLQYPPSVRVLRLPCTGKLDLGYVMRAFERGVDGVIVAGCLEGGCHFQEGNLRARKRVALAKQVLEESGLEPDRLEMFNLSSAQGQTFADIVATVTTRVKSLGPNPLRKKHPPVA